MSPRIENVSRRDFLAGATASAGFVLAVSLPCGRRLMDAAATGLEAATPFEPSVYLALDESGAVTITVHRSEMGQGIRSTLAMAVADDLEADWSRVVIRQAEGDEAKYGDQNTDGSHSVRDFLLPLRQAGTAARKMLEAAAAQKWSVPAAEVVARQHVVTHTPTGRSASYGDLVAIARTLPVPKKEDIVLAPVSALKSLGKDLPSADAVAMTTGAAVYGMDARLPGMRIAVIARPPVYGGRLASVDDSAAKQVAGVERIVRMQSPALPAGFRPLGGVAVVARNTWAAMQARERLKITWEDGPNASYDSPTYRRALEETARNPGRVARNEGDVDAALASAARRLSADYYLAHHAHAVMEPPAALASFADGKCEIWAATQSPQGARNTVAEVLGIPVERVRVNVTFLGGGFGRKSKPDFVAEAAWLSREVGAPVKVVWTREDDLRHDYYHTVSAQHVEAGLDASGKTVAWLHRSVYPSINATFAPGVKGPSDGEMALGCTDAPWDVPNVRCEAGDAEAHVRIGWFRSVCNVPQAFAACSFVDELAHAVGRDPKEFLLDLLGAGRHVDLAKAGVKDWNYGADPKVYPLDTARLRRVIELAAEKAGWGRTLPKGRGLGIAAHRSFLTYVATVVEVEVGAAGALVIPRVTTAVDCGFAANPDRVRSQMEGAAVMGLTLALDGAITMKDGRVVQGNFDAFPLVRIDNAPRQVDVHIVPSEAPPAGVGEPGVPPFAPALCNAIFVATGKRIRQLPIAAQLRS